jgi:hypothetical protein
MAKTNTQRRNSAENNTNVPYGHLQPQALELEKTV